METNSTYGYYSKVLNKPFNTLEELKQAEEKHNKEELQKIKNSEIRKQDSSKVQEAFKQKNLAEKDYEDKINQARTKYIESVTHAKKEYIEVVNECENNLDVAKQKFDAALKEFTTKHPEGYHMTLKDGDNIETISKSALDKDSDITKVIDAANSIFNTIFQLF